MSNKTVSQVYRCSFNFCSCQNNIFIRKVYPSISKQHKFIKLHQLWVVSVEQSLKTERSVPGLSIRHGSSSTEQQQIRSENSSNKYCFFDVTKTFVPLFIITTFLKVAWSVRKFVRHMVAPYPSSSFLSLGQ